MAEQASASSGRAGLTTPPACQTACGEGRRLGARAPVRAPAPRRAHPPVASPPRSGRCLRRVDRGPARRLRRRRAQQDPLARRRAPRAQGRDLRSRCCSRTGRSTSTRSGRRSRGSGAGTARRSATSRRSTTTSSSSGRSSSSTPRATPGGRDLHVVSDWMAGRMIRLGYVERLDRARAAHGGAQPDRPAARAAVRPEARVLRALAVGNDRDRVPKGQGQARAAQRERPVRPGLQGQGHGSPRALRHRPDGAAGHGRGSGDRHRWTSCMEAIDKVSEASSSGQIRRFTGNEYTRDLGKGDSWLVLGWSGDAIQLQADNPQIGFVQPEEGFLLWSDNMQIPIGAPHGYTAEKFMDFVYRPEIQKPITEWVNYVCPVKGVQELVERDDPGAGLRPPDLPHRREPGRRHRPQAARAARRSATWSRRSSRPSAPERPRVSAPGARPCPRRVARIRRRSSVRSAIPAEVDRVGVAELEGLCAVVASTAPRAQELEVVRDRAASRRSRRCRARSPMSRRISATARLARAPSRSPRRAS